MKKHRHLNYELLRIISMLMIVCLHYLDKGGALTRPKETFSSNSYVAWFVEAFCLVSVNIYVLISGYFGVDTIFNVKKPLKIWLQVFFYSVIIGVVFMVLGLQKFDIYQMFMYIFPISTEHYWFATMYVILCFIMPFINEGFNKLSQKTIQSVLLCLVVFLSVTKTVIPMNLPIDKYGCDVLWFITLYITGAYIRRYGNQAILKNRFTRTSKKLSVYIIGSLIVFMSMVAIKYLYSTRGILGEMIDYGYAYNYLFTYIASVGLFLAFGKISKDDDSDSAKNKAITTFAGAAFGVYLIHEHFNIRYLWPEWFKCQEASQGSTFYFLFHMIITVFAVYIICTLIELVRIKLFEVIESRLIRNRITNK